MAVFARPQRFGTFSRKLQPDVYLPAGPAVGVCREQGSGQGCTGSQKEDVLRPNLTPLEQKPVALVSSTHPGVSVGKTHPFDENHGISHREGPGAAELEVAHARDGTGDILLLRTGMWGLAARRVSPGLEQQQLCTR